MLMDAQRGCRRIWRGKIRRYEVPNLQPAQSKLAHFDVRIRMHFTLIVKRAKPAVQ